METCLPLIYFILNYVYVCGTVHMSTETFGGQITWSKSYREAVSDLTWMLGTQHGSSAGLAHALNP